MLIFNTENGIATHSTDSQFITQGFSGNGSGLLNPSLQYLHNIGPICRGKYQIKYIDFTPLTYNLKALLTAPQLSYLKSLTRMGPKIFQLIPFPDTKLSDTGKVQDNRGGFFIHWDTAAHKMDASDGCIVFYWEWVFDYIEKMVQGGDDTLEVI